MPQKFLTTVLVLGCLIGAGSVAWSQIHASGVWRYKMTVTIETPEGLKSGSAVREVSNSATSIKVIDLPESGNPAEFKGEAVVVDLGKRGQVFAILGTDPYRELYNAFPVEGASTVKGIQYYNSLKPGTSVQLGIKDYPMLVTFTDIKDPKTVTPVLEVKSDGKHPPTFTIKTDRFEELFGKGVKLKSIQIEMTDEPITNGIIDNFLAWLNASKGSYLSGKFANDGTALGLHGGNFKSGVWR